MNVKRHSIRRYIERVMGVTDIQEINRLTSTKSDEIIEHIKKMYEYSKLIWRGQLFDNITRNYYISGEYILVTDTDNTCVITLWKADLGLPPSVNREAIKGLIGEVERLNEIIVDFENNYKDEVEKRNAENSILDAEIKTLEARIASVKQKKELNDQHVKYIQSEIIPLRKELDQYATMICNSQDYKADLLDIKKG